MIVPVRVVRGVLAVIMLMLGMAVAAPPAAAVSMTCVNYGGAPMLSGSGGVITAYYSHRCNTVSGVTEMTEYLYITSGHCADQSVPRSHRQTAVDFSFEYAPFESGCGHGYWQAVMQIYITGNFSFGSVPGCHRTDADSVFCNWVGPQQYF